MNAYTTIEESKKLLELGLDSKTSDCNWEHAPGYENYEGKITGFWDDPEWGQSGDSKDLPCWSLAALLNIIDNNNIPYILGNNHDNESEYTISVKVINQEGKRQIFNFDKIIGCITWLLERNYIKSNKNE